MADTMKAVAVFAPGDVRVVTDVPIPEPGDYEVLVKVMYCGFCNGSDFQIINNTMEKSEGLQEYPTILGHEGSAYAVKLGKKVRHIQLGDRFIHNNLRPDVGNGYTKTYGGMAEYGLVADHQAMLEDGYTVDQLPFYKKFHKFPREMRFEDGAMLLSLSESLSAVRNFGVKAGSEVLIFGAGPMGTAVATYCKLEGAAYVAIVDNQPARLENAKRIARVDQTINFDEQPVADAVGERRFDVAIDAVGATAVIYQASALLKPYGMVGSMGVLKKNDLLINASRLKNNTSVHMLNFPFDEYGAAMDQNIDYIVSGKIDPADFYSHIVPIDNIHEAMELVRTKKALKVILKIADQ